MADALKQHDGVKRAALLKAATAEYAKAAAAAKSAQAVKGLPAAEKARDGAAGASVAGVEKMQAKGDGGGEGNVAATERAIADKVVVFTMGEHNVEKRAPAETKAAQVKKTKLPDTMAVVKALEVCIFLCL